MKNNIFIKLLCSIPVILVAMYFSKILGICLIIFRLVAIRNSKYTLPSILILVGLVLLIPKGIDMIKSDLPYITDILNSDIYPKLLSYSKFLLIFGIILMILTYIIQLFSSKVNNTISDYINKEQQQEYEIKKENDLKMREKQEQSKYTRVIKCPHCGASNMVKDKTGTCSHCRSPLS